MDKSKFFAFFNAFMVSIYFLFIISCREQQEISSIDELLCDETPVLPVKSSEDALCYAMSIKEIRESLQNAENQMDYSGWSIVIDKEKDMWTVGIKSKGVIPSFICDLTFSEMGEIPYRPEGTLFCEFQK